jgi:endonuclease/exonuclease/phosphatase family metal-dependent hydrolase
LKKLKKYGYTYQKMKTTFQIKDKKWGLAIVSKFPIQKYHALDTLNRFKNNNGMSCEVKTPEGIVEILNIHFKSIHLDYEDYALLEGKTNQLNAKYHQAKLILEKIGSSYPERAEQTDIVLNYLKQSNSKNVLLCCDMNDIPCSYSYHNITKIYEDGFKSSGRGIAKTYDFMVPFRIDYIFHSDNVSFNSYEMKATKLSDHYPIIGHFKLYQSYL